jgi:hypothetical protein
MKEHRAAIWTAAALAALAAGAVAVRMASTDPARPSRADRTYRLTCQIDLSPAKPGTRLRMAVPENTDTCRIHRAAYNHPNLAVDFVRRRDPAGRDAVAVALQPQETATFEATYDVHVTRPSAPRPAADKQRLSTEQRNEYLRSDATIQARDPRVVQILLRLSQGEAAGRKLAERVFDYVCSHIAEAGPHGPADAARALRKDRASTLGRARAMVALCRAARIPARLVTGFVLEDADSTEPHHWAEAHVDGAWVPYDPTAGHMGAVPHTYLPVRRGGPVVRVSGRTGVRQRYAIRQLEPAQAGPAAHGGAAAVLDLSRLGVGMQETISVLLLLPVGALITAIMRTMVGIHTFGTFTPSLLALSFLYADWRTGLLVFVLVVVIGLLARSLLDRLKLLLVPRLSVVLTLVVLLMVLAISVLDRLGLTPSARAVLLPLVILTMVIERFYIRREEDGLRRATWQLAGTLLVAACCLLALGWKQLGALVLRFPEAELFVIAALLLVGRYSGYRLSELIRFRDAARTTPQEPAQ